MSLHPLHAALKAKIPGDWVENHEGSLWLRNELAAILQRVRAGQMEPCPHVTPASPAGVALWAPTRLLCDLCLPVVRQHGDDDYRCDRCAQVVDTINPCLNILNNLVVFYGLCAFCRDREVR